MRMRACVNVRVRACLRDLVRAFDGEQLSEGGLLPAARGSSAALADCQVEVSAYSARAHSQLPDQHVQALVVELMLAVDEAGEQRGHLGLVLAAFRRGKLLKQRGVRTQGAAAAQWKQTPCSMQTGLPDNTAGKQAMTSDTTEGKATQSIR